MSIHYAYLAILGRSSTFRLRAQRGRCAAGGVAIINHYVNVNERPRKNDRDRIFKGVVVKDRELGKRISFFTYLDSEITETNLFVF